MLHGRIFHAHLDQPRRILDIGCGTGRNTVALAKMFPEAFVIGVDLSPVPAIYAKPTNVEYVQGDFATLAKVGDERFQEGSFDYIYHRLLIMGINDWPGYFRNVYKLLSPGGVVEAQEIDIVLRDSRNAVVADNLSAHEFFYNVTARHGLDLQVGQHLQSYMEQSGLVEVEGIAHWWPAVPIPERPETDVGRGRSLN
jgi:cyclopropane fatty-acyl-phospholipid synthase-like methyltransferase